MITAVGKYIYKCHSERRDAPDGASRSRGIFQRTECGRSLHSPDIHRGSVGMTIWSKNTSILIYFAVFIALIIQTSNFYPLSLLKTRHWKTIKILPDYFLFMNYSTALPVTKRKIFKDQINKLSQSSANLESPLSVSSWWRSYSCESKSRDNSL